MEGAENARFYQYASAYLAPVLSGGKRSYAEAKEVTEANPGFPSVVFTGEPGVARSRKETVEGRPAVRGARAEGERRPRHSAIGSMSSAQRATLALSAARRSRHADRNAWSFARDADCTRRCARSRPASLTIGAGTGS
jgi:hypothetical protein